MNSKPNAAAPRVPENGKGLATAGIVGSIAWLFIAAGYSILSGAEFKDLKPNEIGDFLAGVFAPLAFFWLVLGFLQQGAELRNSGQALWLQGEELRNSVEQQKQLVEVTREQLAFESDRITQEQTRARQLAQPRFELTLGGSLTSGGGDGVIVQAFYLTNHGASCTRIKINFDGMVASEAAKLQGGDRIEFSRRLPWDFSHASVVVSYLDAHQDEGSATFTVRDNGPAPLEIQRQA